MNKYNETFESLYWPWSAFFSLFQFTFRNDTPVKCQAEWNFGSLALVYQILIAKMRAKEQVHFFLTTLTSRSPFNSRDRDSLCSNIETKYCISSRNTRLLLWLEKQAQVSQIIFLKFLFWPPSQMGNRGSLFRNF